MSRLSKVSFVFAAISIASFLIIRFLLGAWVPFLWLAIGLTIFFIGFGFFIDRAFFGEFFSMKTTKKGMSMGALISIVLVFLIAVNFIAIRKYKTFDFSMNRVNTLSDQSIQLIKNLKSDLRVIYFYKNGAQETEQLKKAFIDLIRKYQDQSPNVKLEFVDVNERPDLTEKYKVQKGTQSVLLEYEGRTNLLTNVSEQELTSALVKVTRDKDKIIYALTGHGEFPIEASQDGQSIAGMKQFVEGNRYQLKVLNLNQTPEIPADCDVLMIIGPKQNFLDLELKTLEAYLKKGGSLIVAIKPKVSAGLDGILAKIGVLPENDYVVTVIKTPIGNAVDPRQTPVTQFSASSQITKPFGKNEMLVMRLPQSLKVTPVNGLTQDPLLKTADSSIGFKDLQFTAQQATGSQTVGVEVKGKYPGADEKDGSFDAIVLGDSELFDDQLFFRNLNRDFVLNSISSLAKEETMISITPKDVQVTKLQMSETQFVLFIFAFVIPLPLLLFALSGFFWFRRRYS